ncbi:hypothetical protein Nepgr_007827 [Nepenthes gracilis]|uniref:Uncharacterized protein n=1 Tax=Nepenthes gracilis TaxID=150966 RepID=A0AAD3S8G8_NEPGR|nr:hypothetical protein Nepgr_007827 [Nepenthes gracilis]
MITTSLHQVTPEPMHSGPNHLLLGKIHASIAGALGLVPAMDFGVVTALGALVLNFVACEVLDEGSMLVAVAIRHPMLSCCSYLMMPVCGQTLPSLDSLLKSVTAVIDRGSRSSNFNVTSWHQHHQNKLERSTSSQKVLSSKPKVQTFGDEGGGSKDSIHVHANQAAPNCIATTEPEPGNDGLVECSTDRGLAQSVQHDSVVGSSVDNAGGSQYSLVNSEGDHLTLDSSSHPLDQTVGSQVEARGPAKASLSWRHTESVKGPRMDEGPLKPSGFLQNSNSGHSLAVASVATHWVFPSFDPTVVVELKILKLATVPPVYVVLDYSCRYLLVMHLVGVLLLGLHEGGLHDSNDAAADVGSLLLGEDAGKCSFGLVARMLRTASPDLMQGRVPDGADAWL